MIVALVFIADLRRNVGLAHVWRQRYSSSAFVWTKVLLGQRYEMRSCDQILASTNRGASKPIRPLLSVRRSSKIIASGNPRRSVPAYNLAGATPRATSCSSASRARQAALLLAARDNISFIDEDEEMDINGSNVFRQRAGMMQDMPQNWQPNGTKNRMMERE